MEKQEFQYIRPSFNPFNPFSGVGGQGPPYYTKIKIIVMVIRIDKKRVYNNKLLNKNLLRMAFLS